MENDYKDNHIYTHHCKTTENQRQREKNFLNKFLKAAREGEKSHNKSDT